jgi:hypothetical protein
VTARLKTIQTWSFAAIATAIAVPVSAAFLDRPIARFFYHAFGHFAIVRQFAGTPGFLGPLEILVLLAFLVRRIALYPLGYADAVIALCEASLLATTLTLSPLKFLFGRTWPLYGHPSFLIDGAYGFCHRRPTIPRLSIGTHGLGLRSRGGCFGRRIQG